jgi:hypothetical protein
MSEESGLGTGFTLQLEILEMYFFQMRFCYYLPETYTFVSQYARFTETLQSKSWSNLCCPCALQKFSHPKYVETPDSCKPYGTLLQNVLRSTFRKSVLHLTGSEYLYFDFQKNEAFCFLVFNHFLAWY